MNRALCALILALTVSDARANSMADRPLPELFDQATAVATGRLVVLSASCASFGACQTYVATFEIIETHGKSGRLEKGRTAVLCLAPSLKIGHEYTIFVRAKNDSNDRPECTGFVDRDAAFEKRHETYYRVDSYESARIVEDHGDLLYTAAIEVDGLMETLAGLTQHDRFGKDVP